MNDSINSQRRLLLKAGVATLAAAPFLELAAARASGLRKTIPKSGELIHPVGMGTWITFNVGKDDYLREKRTEVLSTFFDMGGQVVDSSPMYGSSEEVVGYGLDMLRNDSKLFSATKTWTRSASGGRQQFRDSQHFWRQEKLTLLQVHNLLAWQKHLPFLRELKQEGLIKYLGITTSHGRRHDELEDILKSEELDFVQLTYNCLDREVESRLLPTAMDRGVAVIANRPFQGGRLFARFESSPLPPWVVEFGISNWAQFFLHFILSHPAITCAIPATTRVSHMKENMGTTNCSFALTQQQRKAMLTYLDRI